MQKVFIKFAFLALITLLFSGCSSFKFPWAYVVTVRQGNIIDAETFQKLEKGMTKKQVRYVLGTPLVEDTFNQNQWDYFFSIRREEKDLYDYRLTVFFEDDVVSHWNGNIDRFKSQKEGLENTKETGNELKAIKKQTEKES